MSKSSRRYSFAHAFSQLLRVILPATLLAISSRAGGAQDFGLPEGARVQVTVPGSSKVTGIVKSITKDSTVIFVENTGGVRRFATSDITELRVSRGKSTIDGLKKGAVRGAGIGAALAVLILATPDTEGNYYYADSNSSVATQVFLGSIVWGVGLGGLVKAEHWDTVPLRAGVRTSSGGVGLSFSFSPSFLH